MRAIQDFCVDVYGRVIGGQPRQDWLVAGVAWFGAESGWGSKGAQNNPWNTTQAAPGTTDFNQAGVKNYPSYAEGLQATVETLTNGRYSSIIGAMAHGTDTEIAAAIHASPWGTENFQTLVNQVRARYSAYENIGIPGSGTTPLPPTPGGVMVQPEFSPPIEIVSMCVFGHPTVGLAVAAVASDGAVFCQPANAYQGGANGRQFFTGRSAALIGPATNGYIITDTRGETYQFPTDAP